MRKARAGARRADPLRTKSENEKRRDLTGKPRLRSATGAAPRARPACARAHTPKGRGIFRDRAGSILSQLRRRRHTSSASAHLCGGYPSRPSPSHAAAQPRQDRTRATDLVTGHSRNAPRLAPRSASPRRHRGIFRCAHPPHPRSRSPTNSSLASQRARSSGSPA
eukprot:363347-Chlamydomonas_euryale.AAC.3